MNGSILIVDDDRDQTTFLGRYFLQAGYRVVEASHPRQALRAATHQQFEVALIDLSLPEMDGAELIDRLHHYQELMKAIVLSGYANPYSPTDVVFAWVQKPYSLTNLRSVVDRALGHASEARQTSCAVLTPRRRSRVAKAGINESARKI